MARRNDRKRLEVPVYPVELVRSCNWHSTGVSASSATVDYPGTHPARTQEEKCPVGSSPPSPRRPPPTWSPPTTEPVPPAQPATRWSRGSPSPTPARRRSRSPKSRCGTTFAARHRMSATGSPARGRYAAAATSPGPSGNSPPRRRPRTVTWRSASPPEPAHWRPATRPATCNCASTAPTGARSPSLTTTRSPATRPMPPGPK
jgi:hypothetical protein